MKIKQKCINDGTYKIFYKYIFKFNIFIFKILFIIIIIFLIMIYIKILYLHDLDININYSQMLKNLNLTFYQKLKKKIRIGIYTFCIKNGGRARLTTILINYLYKVKILRIYLFTRINKEENEYKIPENIKRIIINNNLIRMIIKNKIDILIYQLNYYDEINLLNKIKNIKVIFYQHTSFFYQFYSNFSSFIETYKEYKNSKFIISIIQLENDYLFKKWGIKSILMDNFITYKFNSIITSNLSSKTILMFGRGNNKFKRFDLGIHSMEYITHQIKDCKMKIISNLEGTFFLQNLINNLNLENHINFFGFSLTPEIHFKNASLHIFPTISESFGLVLSESKIFGIPNILLGLDYVSISKGGTIIIYDDTPESIGKEAIKILNNYKYKKNLGKEAKKSMKKFNNDLLFKKWIKLLFSIQNDEFSFKFIRNNQKHLKGNAAINILKKQIYLIKIRKLIYTNISINDLTNFTRLEMLNRF